MPEHLGEFEYAVLLALLRLGQDAYGVPIRDEIEERSGRSVSLGALYTTLSRLEDKGLLDSRMGRPTAVRGGRRKKLCRLTPAGEAALSETWSMQRRMTDGLEGRLEEIRRGAEAEEGGHA